MDSIAAASVTVYSSCGIVSPLILIPLYIVRPVALAPPPHGGTGPESSNWDRCNAIVADRQDYASLRSLRSCPSRATGGVY
jgi:hypothetical protein